jgi:ABC-2 type transport system ATP-binding protein
MLVVDHVRRSFGSVQAVRDVSLTCRRGSVHGLLGPNGAGKTTTMRMILGIYPPDAGTIGWMGGAIDRKLRRRFGYLPEERGLYGKMRVFDQMVYFGRLHGLHESDARKRAERWIETLGLGQYARRSCSELSKGNQQKVQMACAVLHEPELLVLDEPFAGLDPVNAVVMLECIRAIAEDGAAVLLSSHQMWQIEHACSAFTIIGAGEVRAQGTLDELRRAFPKRKVRVVPDLPAIRAAFARYGAPPPLADGVVLAYELPTTTDFGALLREAVAAGPVESFQREEPSLNEIYVDLLKCAAVDAAA